MAAPDFPVCQPLSDLEVSNGGYDDQLFLDPAPESLQCPVCLLVLRDPHLLSCCGAHICQVCIQHIQVSQQPCPCCRDDDYTMMLDKNTRGKVLGLRVRCENHDCDWKGELGDLQRHLDNRCVYVKQECHHGCGEQYYRHLLQVHEQDECTKRILEVKIESYQRQVFEKFIALESKHKEEVEHLKEQQRKQEREFCHKLEEQEKRLQQVKTEQEEKMIAFKKQQSEELSQLIMKLQPLPMKGSIAGEVPKWYCPVDLMSHHLLPPILIAMNNFSQHKSLEDPWYSPPFYSGAGGYKLQLRVEANGYSSGKGTHLSVFVYLLKGENDEKLKWPFMGDLNIQLLNWREDEGHKEILLGHNSTPLGSLERVMKGERAACGMIYRRFVSHTDLLYNLEKNTKYLYNDTLCFRVSRVTLQTGHEVPIWSINSSATIIPSLMTMCNFSEHKRIGDLWYSPPFYSAAGGYKLQLRVMVNDKGNVCVVVCLLKGENDELLEWPFLGQINIHVLNWKENNGHVEKIIDLYNAPLECRDRVTEDVTAPKGWSINIPSSDLDNNQNKGTKYLHNDMLCIRVTEVIILGPDPVPSWYVPPSTKSLQQFLPFTATLRKYSQCKKNDFDWNSQPFYTGAGGYKMRLLVYSNGDSSGKGTHVSVYVILVKGENDDKLNWPFKGDLTIQLLSWKMDKGHFERVLSFNENTPLDCRSRITDGTKSRCFGYPQFIPHIRLQHNNTEYLKHDALCFRVSAVVVYST